MLPPASSASHDGIKHCRHTHISYVPTKQYAEQCTMVKRKMHTALGTLWSVPSYVLFWQPFLELTIYTTILWYGTLVVWFPTWRGWRWTSMGSCWNFECFPIGCVVVVCWFLCCSLGLRIEWGEYLELVNPVRLVWPPSSDLICFLVNTVKEFCFQFSYFGESNQLFLWACFQCCHDNACCCTSFLFLLCVRRFLNTML